ncbi:hypothetical protein HHK36_017171 [Tetracentron sinense]|uniref:Protein SMG7 n=1 Tax=Tetracentron sinense TaxID=13715 RepID=A0A834YYE8_TETSI|nr:hypothetical protein HHK36_017171 [Tetracentron sinense]
MMTVPMDNLYAPSRDLAQRLYNKNIELENRRRRSVKARIPSDPNAWQQIRENYEAIILEDHVFSEQHEIEFALWQLHYKRIEELRAHFSAALASTGAITSQGGKGPTQPDRVTKIRSQFKTFLSEATGFYHDLILKVREKYGMPLGYFSEDPENQIVLEKDGKKSAEMKKGLISCHRCLIYLGDLARYKGLYGEGESKTRDYAAASSYYMQAASLCPSSGNPHNQLAILATYSGDELVAVYRYFRSLAVDSPFSTARDNLIIAFEKNRQSYSQLLGDAKVSSVQTVSVRMSGKGRWKGEARMLSKDAGSIKERACSISETYNAFCIRFVRLNGILFTRTSLETFGEVFSLVCNDLHVLLSSGLEEDHNFGLDAVENGLVIVRLIVILIFTVHNVIREPESQSYAEILQRSVLLQNAFTVVFEFMGCIIKRCIQLHDPLSSYLLPGILVFLEWLACRPDIAAGNDVEDKQATARSFFWNHCISFLNKLLSSGFVSIDDEDETCFFNMSRYDEGETGYRLALWEDFELRGFLPLLPAQVVLDFSRKHSFGSDGGKDIKARVQRILAAGKALAKVVQVEQQGIYFDTKLKKFAIGVEPQMSDDFVLTSSMDMPKSNGRMQENPVETMNLGLVQPKAGLCMEGEEEDEVIVFKPTVSEKHSEVIAPKLTSYEVLEPGKNSSKGEQGSYIVSFSAPSNDLCLQTALDASSQPPTSFDNTVPHRMQPIQPSASNWIVEQQASIANRMTKLSLVENGFVMKPELQEGLDLLQPAALSLPLPQSVNLTVGSVFSGHRNAASETMIPSKFDSIMSSGANVDSLSVNTSSALPASSKKNPVSRPIRHFGPPPGFSHVPPKQIDEPFSGSASKNENPPMDDYSWLDGYQLPSSTKFTGANNFINHTTHVYPNFMANSSSLNGPISFPFPGKQVPTVQVQLENQKGWQNYPIHEHLNLYQEQQQLQKGNPQSNPLPEQFQGQSLWEGRFFV